MSLTGISANRLELLQIADAVAREKSIDREIVIEAIEEAIQKGARARYGAEHDIRVNIDQKTGEVTVKRVQTVVADDASFGTVMSEEGEEVPADEPVGIIRLSDAKRTDKDAAIGKTYEGYEARLELDRVAEGRKRFKGLLAGVEDDAVAIDLEGEEETAMIPFSWITDAKLVLTDQLMKRGADVRAARLQSEQQQTSD